MNQGLEKQDFARRLADANPFITSLMTGLQEERRASMAVVVQGNAQRSPLTQARALLDAELVNVTPVSDALREGAPPEFLRNVDVLQQQIAELPRVRQRIDQGQSSVQDVDTSYSSILGVFVSALRELSRTAPDADAAYLERFGADYQFAVESMARSRALATAAFSKTGLNAQQFEHFSNLGGNYHELLDTLVITLPPDLRIRYEALVASSTWQLNELVERTVSQEADRNNFGRYTAALPVEQTAWQNAASDVQRRIGSLGAAQAANASEELRQSGQDQLVRILLGSIILLLIAAIAFTVSIRLSAGVISRLVGLRKETLTQAEERLPSIINRLREGEKVDVGREIPPLNFGRDEIGQVAEAFNRAQSEAVTAAVREAETRAGTAKVFLNIAHRSQVIVHRQLKVLDQAERAQDDPEQLKLLFQLDHLATRARRNAENLIILGGGQPGRQWRNAVPLLQVVRSAIGESETYVRVSFGSIPDVTLEGAAVADVVHLVAELVDNATNFSPPTARVEVRGNIVGKGVVIEVEDQGLGIEPRHREELNSLLHSPPDFSVMALSQEPRLGLFVVAQLASRHGVHVTLADSPAYGGTRAIVLVPSSIIAGRGDGSPLAELGGPGQNELPATPMKATRHGRRAESALNSVTPTGQDDPLAGRGSGPFSGNGRTPAPSVRAVPSPSTPVSGNRPLSNDRPLSDDRPLSSDTGPLSSDTGPRTGSGPLGDSRPLSGSTSPVTGPTPVTPSRPVPPTISPVPPLTASTFDTPPRGLYLNGPGTGSTPSQPPVPARPPQPPAPPATPSYPPVSSVPPPLPPAAPPSAPPARDLSSPLSRGPASSPMSAVPPLSMPGSSPAPSSAGMPGDDRPVLPRRTRQANLVPQLREEEARQPELRADQDLPPAEATRDRLAAFQRGTRQGRDGEN